LQEGPIIYGAQRIDGGVNGIRQTTPTCFLSFEKYSSNILGIFFLKAFEEIF
jgi:hypothetical protein